MKQCARSVTQHRHRKQIDESKRKRGAPLAAVLGNAKDGFCEFCEMSERVDVDRSTGVGSAYSVLGHGVHACVGRRACLPSQHVMIMRQMMGGRMGGQNTLAWEVEKQQEEQETSKHEGNIHGGGNK